jgi:putative transposase
MMAFMTRIARVVVAGLPHHVTQRGNRGERIFFEAEDFRLYKDWLAQSCRRFGVACWAYCLMPNHVHLILTPDDRAGLALALSRLQITVTPPSLPFMMTRAAQIANIIW